MSSNLLRDNNSIQECYDKIKRAMNSSASTTFRALRAAKKLSAKEGDFLVRRYATYDWREGKKTWHFEQFSANNSSLRKYQVVFIDEFGLPYFKKVLANGSLGTELIPLANYDLVWTEFVPDPEYIDHIILSDEGDEDSFDPLDTYKELKVGTKKNK